MLHIVKKAPNFEFHNNIYVYCYSLIIVDVKSEPPTTALNKQWKKSKVHRDNYYNSNQLKALLS